MDSLFHPKKIIEKAKSIGLDFIAITDHNTIQGGVRAKLVEQNAVKIIIGSEINTDCGDLTGLFLNEEIKSRTFGEVVDEIKDQDGIVVLPHPCRRKKYPDSKLIQSIDIIEVYNARTSGKLNMNAQKLTKKLKKQMIIGSDAHFSFELGRVWNTITDMSDFDDEELRKKLLNGNIEIHNKGYNPLMRKISIILGTTIKKIKI